MNNLLELIKVDLRETLDVRKFKENKSKSIPFLAFILSMGVLFLFISIIYNLIFSAMFYDVNVNLVHSTILMSAITSILCFTTSVFKVKGIFVGKDYDMLRSMPIKKTHIIFSKIFNLYLTELLYSAIILIPNIVINIIFTGDLMYIPIGISAVILIPALPMMIACLISLFITLVADRFRFGNVINFILYVILFICIFGFSFLMNSATSDAELVNNIIQLTDKIIWINPSIFLIKYSFLNNHLYLILFIIANLSLLGLVVSFISLLFDKVHNIISSHRSDVKYVRKSLESKGQFKSLLSIEFKRFFNSKFYFINSISSGICGILMGIFIAYMFSEYSYIEDADRLLPFVREYAYVGSLMIMFGIGIATPASSAISIEGPNFWMIKAYPIDYNKLMQAKIFLSTLVLGVCSLVTSIVMIILIKPTIFASIMLIVLPIIYVLLVSIVSLKINLAYPKLKWKNEQEVVKQSASVVITMFIDWAIMIVLAGLLVGLSFVNVYVGALSGLAALIIFSVIFYKWIMRSCEKSITKMEDF